MRNRESQERPLRGWVWGGRPHASLKDVETRIAMHASDLLVAHGAGEVTGPAGKSYRVAITVVLVPKD